ncbi:MAG: glyoxalase [Planctomycetes bacterium]|nr:glyoxalase [Planctomycetota bacterium]
MTFEAPRALSQIALTVENVERSLRFYRDVLGLPLLFAPSPDLAFLSIGGIRLMLTRPQGAGRPGENSILYFEVVDIERAHATLCERGATSERGPTLTARLPQGELWTSFVRDPDGNLLGLQEMLGS